MERSTGPTIQEINKIEFVEPKRIKITEQIPLFLMTDVQNETVRLDLYFNGGKNVADKGLSSFVNGLLLSGTNKRTSIEINESINALGGFHESGISMENSVITIYCLREFLVDIFNSSLDAIKNVNFNESEVVEYLADRKLNHRVSLEKVNYLAQREFQKRLFDSEKNYSNVVEEEDFNSITRDELIKFHDKFYRNGLTKVTLVGNINEQQLTTVVNACKTIVNDSPLDYAETITNLKGEIHVEKKDALQTAVRVGRILFNKKHADYPDFLVLNTILGDYFGSRLMSNIREDKGYTYGIGSMLNEFNQTGYFMIGTEVRGEVTADTITQIKLEIERLQSEFVSDEEMELVRNYMLGQLLKSADGPYAMTDLFMSVEGHGKSLDFYNEMIQRIKSITPSRIMELANQYLNWEDMTVVTAGK